MQIEINGYKNLNNLKYEIEDNKINYLFGLCGCGKTSITEALTCDQIEEKAKQINYVGDTFISVNGVPKESGINYSIFNNESLKKYIISRNDETAIYNLFIDNDDGELIKAKDNLDDYLRSIRNLIISNQDYANRLFGIQKNFGTNKLTKTGGITKTSMLSKAKTAFVNASSKTIYKRIVKINNAKYKWILEGEKLIEADNRCPFCGKKISIKLRKTLDDYKNFDSKFISTFELTGQQRQDIKINRNPVIESEIDKLTDKMISMNKALSSWIELNDYLDKLDDYDFDSKKLKPIVLEEDFYHWFTGFKKEIKKLNKHIEKIKTLVDESNKLTKGVLTRKLNKINKLLLSLSIPYKIVPIKSSSRIQSYEIHHIEDSQKLNRADSLSEGEKVILSLILFLVENSNLEKELIIIDDPVSSFDDVRRGAINYTILNYLGGKTVLLLSHDAVFAKYAANEKFAEANKFIGKIDYIDNYKKQVTIIPIVEEDINSLENFIKEHVEAEIPSFVKFLNARLMFESRDRKISLLNKTYSYLSDCYHLKRREKFAKDRIKKEAEILEMIKNKTGLDEGQFENSMYQNIDTTNLTYFDKALLMRCMIDCGLITDIPDEIKNELNDYVHLSSRYIICLNPYKFDFSTKSVREVIDSKLNRIVNL